MKPQSPGTLPPVPGAKQIIYVVIAILVLFLLGAYFLSRPGRIDDGGLTVTGEDGREGQVPPPSQIPPGTPKETVSMIVKAVLPDGKIPLISGVITNAAGNILNIDVPSILGVKIPKEADIRGRVVFISQATKVVDRILKDEAVYERELAEYGQNRGGEPPSPYKYLNLKPSELEVGDTISVQSGGEDIKTLGTIQATNVTRVLRKP